GEGVETLYDALADAVFAESGDRETESAIAQRHEKLLKEALSQLEAAVPELYEEAWELAAVHVREAIYDLGTITGENAAPDVLDEIFSRFCIGK
ncbi:MAG: tRNA uridine-5-carboxymethylaminomethyl(34) synthesis GTPase MnmE, partial [Lentisphaeria bacterium]|nr:tRNA uridine-5-carboxymethylaminomethyl(34) synthesis GTPase MnmE [Lentisphaeria bacterium]